MEGLHIPYARLQELENMVAFSIYRWPRQIQISPSYVLPGQWPKKPQTPIQACRQNDTAQQLTKHSRMYLRLCGSQETNRGKVPTSSSSFSFLLSSQQPWFVCKLARAVGQASCDSAKFQHSAILRQQKVVVLTCILNTCISHVSPSACSGGFRGAYGNPWWLMIITARRSFYQPSWTCSCLDLPIMVAWLSFHDHINFCNAWHNIINGNRMKQQILLLRGVDS